MRVWVNYTPHRTGTQKHRLTPACPACSQLPGAPAGCRIRSLHREGRQGELGCDYVAERRLWGVSGCFGNPRPFNSQWRTWIPAAGIWLVLVGNWCQRICELAKGLHHTKVVHWSLSTIAFTVLAPLTTTNERMCNNFVKVIVKVCNYRPPGNGGEGNIKVG